MTKWEYKVVTIRQDNSVGWDDIKEHGAEGWELVTVVPYTTTLVAFYFKRPLVEIAKNGPLVWHNFTDGIIPALDAQVEIRRRNGTQQTGKASTFRWNDQHNEFDIVAWRLNG